MVTYKIKIEFNLEINIKKTNYKEPKEQLICGDDNNLYIIDLSRYLQTFEKPIFRKKITNVHINKCLLISTYQKKPILISQKSKRLVYISLEDFSIISTFIF